MMELSFACENSAQASYLAQELELALRDRGIPADAMVLKPSSPENMDIGSILSFSVENASQILAAASSLATVASCIVEIATKFNSDVVVDDAGSKVKIPAAKIDMARVQAALASKPRPKPKH
jgi:hypothetical protein